MTLSSSDIDVKVRRAIQHFWLTRASQARKQGATGARDAGARVAVTGGAQMDGFVDLITEALYSAGVSEAHVFQDKKMELPGWYGPRKSGIYWLSPMAISLLALN